ncbi:MAG: efflux RND transporter periplasmic adaptor subunit [Gammaproteobacteria bacterium]|nr:efflux RND transporter periplasmic adaptor subunit [Gammaproteobacteria bacterium]
MSTSSLRRFFLSIWFFLTNPLLLAIVITTATFFWMQSGQNKDDETALAIEQIEKAPPTQRVQVGEYVAQQLDDTLQFTGQSEAIRFSQISAEREGTVIEVGVERGDSIQQGELIIKLSEGTANDELISARAALSNAELEYNSQSELLRRGLVAANSLEPYKARLAQARAQLSKAQKSMNDSEVVAPFDGLMADRHVELGDYIRVGTPIADIVELGELKISGYVSERDVLALKKDMPADVTMLNGKTLAGKISYISPLADTATRSYQVEVKVKNPDNQLLAGMTTSVDVVTGKLWAHKISPALLSLSDDGKLGIRVVDDNNAVRFYPVEIVKTETDGYWMTGLPRTANVITMGQGFVRDGQEVIPVSEKEQ